MLDIRAIDDDERRTTRDMRRSIDARRGNLDVRHVTLDAIATFNFPAPMQIISFLK
jgi:hypothetical protein